LKMRRSYLVSIPVLLILAVLALFSYQDEGASAIPKTTGDEAIRAEVLEAYAKLPLYFIENRGQLNREVSYYTKSPNQTLYFTPEGVVFDLWREKDRDQGSVARDQDTEGRREMERLVFSLLFLNSHKQMKIEPAQRQEARVNYLIGNDPKQWKTDIPTYRELTYRDIYKGIDLRFYGKEKGLTYDLIIHPGSDPRDIRFGYQGIEGLKVSREGELIIQTAFGELTQSRPHIYQEIEGRKVEVEGGFVVHSPQSIAHSSQNEDYGPLTVDRGLCYGFEIARYNPEYPLIIDPTLSYSTYLGGSGDDCGYGIAVDSSNCAYVTGFTTSPNFPTANPIQPANAGNWDVFITKLNAQGNGLVYSTYLGGSGSDYGNGIAVDSSNCAYVTGGTYSTNFPTANPIQGANAGGPDAFITKLNAQGNGLAYSTYLGGSGSDYGKGIAVDSSNCAYVTGGTTSPNFPIQNPIQGANAGVSDAFITKLNAQGNGLVYSTYLGGNWGGLWLWHSG
jgi:hypothetical protein